MKSISYQVKKMIDNKNVFNKSKLFNCILGLNEIESNVFSFLLKHNNVSIQELMSIINRDRSSIQRALQELLDLDIIIRESMSLKNYAEMKNIKNINKKGYLFVYSGKDINEVRKKFRNLLDKWYNSMIKYIDSM
ncbi:MAG: hypothetical protein JXA99_07690 [Candidatus Lokiarchaeota archaeon]|nr:hypothetical protein [Candidatus Lokiarchaeota archaeon]